MRHRTARERGFTLIEVIVTTVVLTVVMLGLYVLLDSSNKLAKQETNVAEAQQSVRIGIYELARVIRQARVGGLFVANAVLPIENNIDGGNWFTENDPVGTRHYIRKGTDVIGVRGIISGDKYGLSTGDVTCGGSCATTNAMTVTIRATSSVGIVNFPPEGAPSIAGKKLPFYFVVADSSTEMITTGSGTYLIPVYYVGLVDTTATPWYTQTADTFTFVMNPADAGARKLGAAAPSAISLDKPFSGGVVDEILFFVDEGTSDGTPSTADTHPALAEAILDPSSDPSAPRYEIQPLVQEVEDFQVAYGVDGADGTAKDRGVSPVSINTGANLDEWVGNVANANEIETTLQITGNPKRVDAFIDASMPSGPTAPIATVAALRSVMVSLVVKSADPDFKYDGPGARGMKVLDSTARPFSDAASTGRPYRRRLQSFAVSLRNYQ